MAESRNFRSLRSKFQRDGSRAWLANRRRFRAFLVALAARRVSRHAAQPAAVWTENAYLLNCCDRAIDAHTVEEAVFWHGEIVSELSVEIQLVGQKKWSPQIKARVIADLTEQQDRHAVAVDRLMRITKPLVWRPEN